ncbi:hypothetical protein Tcan_00907, partial [Toxocara canis]
FAVNFDLLCVLENISFRKKILVLKRILPFVYPTAREAKSCVIFFAESFVALLCTAAVLSFFFCKVFLFLCVNFHVIFDAHMLSYQLLLVLFKIFLKKKREKFCVRYAFDCENHTVFFFVISTFSERSIRLEDFNLLSCAALPERLTYLFSKIFKRLLPSFSLIFCLHVQCR